jgi:hypothetical protein
MRRSLLLLALLYAYGDARFEGYRPGALDRPLRNFHYTMDRAWSDGRRAVAVIDDARNMRYLEPLLRHLGNDGI